jgi:hypothetical protein
MITVKDIVEEWLRSKGYTGLYGEECGCEIDDLMPCAGWDNGFDMCHPGYKHGCPATCEECSYDESCDMDRDFTSWYISGDK